MEPDTEAAFSFAQMRTWFIEDAAAKVGQFPEAELVSYVRGIEMLTQELATVSAVPPDWSCCRRRSSWNCSGPGKSPKSGGLAIPTYWPSSGASGVDIG